MRRKAPAKAPSSEALKDLRILVGDFETFFAKDYSLRNKGMSTSLYVRDTRFKAQCFAAMYQDDPYPKIYFDKDINKFLQSVDWKRTAFLAHHTQFDGLILSHHYGVRPAFMLDTLSMARALHSSDMRSDLDTLLKHYGFGGKHNPILNQTKGIRDLPPVLQSLLGDYCRGDIIDLLKVFQLMLPKFPDGELRKIDMFVRMFTDPRLGVNRALATKEYRRQVRERNEKIEETGEDIEELRSREKFAELLRSRGVEPPMKTKKRKDGTKYETYAFAKTDRAFQELKLDKRVADLIEGKLAASSTIGESRAEALLERSERGMKLPIYLNYAKAHTLRTTGGDKFNPQNFPARGKDSRLKECIIAPPGMEVCTVDSAQIECRENAWFAGQEDLLQAFRDKRDVYAEMAAEIYRKPIDKKKNPDERFIGKTTVLGAGYQMSGAKFQLMLAMGTAGPPVFIDRDLADEAIAAFRRKNHKIAANWVRMQNLISAMANGTEYEHKGIRFVRGAIEMPNGLSLRYPALRWREAKTDDEFDGWVYGVDGTTLYGGKLTENLIQSLAYITVSDQALEIQKRYKVAMFTHDEVVFLAPKREAGRAVDWAIDVMSQPPSWAPDLPLAAEGCHDGFYRKPG